MFEGAPQPNRREVLRGLGAFFIANGYLNRANPLIAGERYEDKVEAQEALVQAIHEHAALLKDNEELFADGFIRNNRAQSGLLVQAPPAIRETLKGSELDPEEFFRSRDSWPSFALVTNRRTAVVSPQIVGEESQFFDKEEVDHFFTGNGFMVDGLMITNDHMYLKKDQNEYETCANEYDITAKSIYDNDANEIGWQDLRKNVGRLSMDWDRRRNNESLHGKVIHIASVHNLRGQGEDNTEINTGVAWNYGDFTTNDRYYENDELVNAKRPLEETYGVVVQPQDFTGDGRVGGNDFAGLSGSVVMTEEDVVAGRYQPSGIVTSYSREGDANSLRSFHVLVIHGPKVIGRMIDEANTLISKEQTPDDIPNLAYITKEVQVELSRRGFELEVDGAFGPMTEEVVKAFQTQTFDEETLVAKVIPGVVDRRTWNALFPGKANPSKFDLLYGA